MLRAKQSTTVAIQFLAWLGKRGRSLPECTQHDIDAWLAEGTSTRQHVNRFVSWALDQRIVRNLTIPRTHRTGRNLSEPERLTRLRDLLLHDTLSLAYRIAGGLILLTEKQARRIVTLRVEHVQVEETATRLPLGGHWVDVPEPFATLLRDHLNRRANMNTAANAGSSWLFPGQMPGRHLHPQTVVDVLRDAGIPPLAARTGTWLRLVRGDTASGRAYMSELGRARDGRQGLNYAIYHDRYQRTGDGWKFTERVYEVRYEDTTPLAGSPPRPAGAPADPPAENTAAAEGPR